MKDHKSRNKIYLQKAGRLKMLTVYKANFNLEDYLAFFSDRRTPAEGEANTKDRL